MMTQPTRILQDDAEQQCTLANEVTLADVLREIGFAKYRDFVSVVAAIYGPDAKLGYRFAPSIVLKSEVEVFDISTPRFAIRATVTSQDDKEILAVINLRRIRTFCGQIVDWFDSSKDDEKPADVIRPAAPIADSFFSIPEKMTEEFVGLEVEWGTLFGEERKNSGIVCKKGVPFINHIPLAGGGLCAQAACYMCATILKEHATSIHGLAEITMLANQTSNEFMITGLGLKNIANYFSKIGLGAIPQQVKRHLPSRGGPIHDAKTKQDNVSLAMRAYIKSGIPIVLPVNFFKMASQLLDSNWDRLPERVRVDLPTYVEKAKDNKKGGEHVVVVVGCERKNGDLSNTKFLINDPATVPFLVGTPLEILHAAAPFQTPSTPPNLHEELITLLPVTHEKVKLPLLDFDEGLLVEDDEPPARFNPKAYIGGGLISTMHRWIRKFPDPAYKDIFDGFPVALDDLKLSRFCHLKAGEHAIRVQNAYQILSKLQANWKWEDDHWVWSVLIGDTLLMWDAEKQLPQTKSEETHDSKRAYFRAFLRFQQDRTVGHCFLEGELRPVIFHPETHAVPDADSENAVKPTLREHVGLDRGRLFPSFISSFSLFGLETSVRLADTKKKLTQVPVELYTFMQRDAEHLLAPRRAKIFRAGRRFSKSVHVGTHRLIALVERRFKGFKWSRWVRGHKAQISCIKLHKFKTLFVTKPAIDRMAASLDSDCANVALALLAKTNGRPIKSIATYLPEISSRSGTGNRRVRNRWAVAQRALQYAVRLGGQLAQVQRLAHPFVVELVAGNLVRGVSRSPVQEDHGIRAYKAHLNDPESAKLELLNRLEPVAAEAEKSNVFLALELEPGPLSVLGSLSDLVRLCELLEKRYKPGDPMYDRVGFNLDIPHWAFLGGVDPGSLSKGPADSVRRRIIHAHISDHSIGHYGDSSIGLINNIDKFAPWIDLLKQRNLENSNPKFSGYIAVEMEACKDVGIVSDSVRVCDDLCATY